MLSEPLGLITRCATRHFKRTNRISKRYHLRIKIKKWSTNSQEYLSKLPLDPNFRKLKIRLLR